MTTGLRGVWRLGVEGSRVEAGEDYGRSFVLCISLMIHYYFVCADEIAHAFCAWHDP
jgi:hypothetical protein